MTSKLKTIVVFMLLSVLLTGCNNPLEESLKTRMQQMSEMADFGSVEYTVKKVIKASDVQWYTVGDRKILFTCTAYLKAEIDLGKLSDEDVIIDKTDKAVEVTLPHAKLLSINMPAEAVVLEYSSVSFFRSSFSAEERNELLKQGEADIIADVGNMGILADAESNASDFFSAMLYQLGFEKVTVKFEDKEEVL